MQELISGMGMKEVVKFVLFHTFSTRFKYGIIFRPLQKHTCYYTGDKFGAKVSLCCQFAGAWMLVLERTGHNALFRWHKVGILRLQKKSKSYIIYHVWDWYHISIEQVSSKYEAQNIIRRGGGG